MIISYYGIDGSNEISSGISGIDSTGSCGNVRVGIATIKDIERGKGNPSLNTINEIIDVSGVEIDYKIRETVT